MTIGDSPLFINRTRKPLQLSRARRFPSGRCTNGDGNEVDNADLAVRLRYATGLRDATSPAARDDAVWQSAFVATRAIGGPDGGFTVEVAVTGRVGRRYVADATPLRGERMMLGGVLLLGLGFASAAALGLRRQ